MRLALVFLAVSSIILVGACGGDDGDGPGAGAVTEACKKYCSAAVGASCEGTQVTESQCQAQCSYLADQLLGVCEAENVAAFECVAAGGFECMGVDTDGDGVDDTFVPIPKDQCLEEQQAMVTCEQTAGCKRYCKVAGDEGCGTGCLDACEKRADELDSGGFNCSYGYQSFVGCSARVGVECAGSNPQPAVECIDAAFSAGECLSGDSDLCAIYCFGAEEVGCASDCAADCASRSADATCGSQWNSILDCMTFFGDAVCQDKLLVPDPNGICSSERESYLSCAGSF